MPSRVGTLSGLDGAELSALNLALHARPMWSERNGASAFKLLNVMSPIHVASFYAEIRTSDDGKSSTASGV